MLTTTKGKKMRVYGTSGLIPWMSSNTIQRKMREGHTIPSPHWKLHLRDQQEKQLSEVSWEEP